jgi:hypothetical protein
MPAGCSLVSSDIDMNHQTHLFQLELNLYRSRVTFHEVLNRIERLGHHWFLGEEDGSEMVATIYWVEARTVNHKYTRFFQ